MQPIHNGEFTTFVESHICVLKKVHVVEIIIFAIFYVSYYNFLITYVVNYKLLILIFTIMDDMPENKMHSDML